MSGGLRYRYFERLLESLKKSAGYNELYHRVFDFINFYKVRRFLSVDVNGVSVPSVQKVDGLTLENVTGSWANYIFRWDWTSFGKNANLESEENKGVGLTAPFGLSSHGYYDNSENKDGSDVYCLYFMDVDGRLLADYDIPMSDDPRKNYVFLVWAKPGTTTLSNDSCLCLDTEELRNEVFRLSYISFNGSTTVSTDSSGAFYSQDYSQSENATSHSTYQLLPRQGGNTSVARFREESLNRGANDSNVFYTFNNGERGESHHVVQDYVEVKKCDIEGGVGRIITQNGLLLSPGDVWYSDFYSYYEFRLHVGKFDSANYMRFSPDNWGVVDSFVRFKLSFTSSDFPTDTEHTERTLDYTKFPSSTVTLKDFENYVKSDDLFGYLLSDTYNFTILVENSSISTSEYDIVFRTENYFNVVFEPIVDVTPMGNAFCFSRYTSYYMFHGLMQFAKLSSSISDLFEIQIGTETPFYYTPSVDPNEPSNLALPNFTSVGGLDYNVLNNNDVHDLYLTRYTANDNTFPAMTVKSEYCIAFVDTISNDAAEGSIVNIYNTLPDTVSGLCITDPSVIDISDAPVKFFSDIFTPVANTMDGANVYDTFYTYYSKISNIYTFLSTDIRNTEGIVDFKTSENIRKYYQQYVSIATYIDAPYSFPNTDSTNSVYNLSESYPYQFFTKDADISSLIFPTSHGSLSDTSKFSGYFMKPAYFDVAFDFEDLTITESNSSFVWLSLPSRHASLSTSEDLTPIYHLLVSDYSQAILNPSYYQLLKVYEEKKSYVDYSLGVTNTYPNVIHIYYILVPITIINNMVGHEDVPNFTDNAWSWDFSYYFEKNAISACESPTESGYYFENEVAKVFYTRNPFSTYYSTHSLTKKRLCELIDSTMNVYASRILSLYTNSLSGFRSLRDIVSNGNFFSCFNSDGSLRIYDLCTTFISTFPKGFSFESNSLGFHRGVTENPTNCLVIGNKLKISDITYSNENNTFEPIQLYKFETLPEGFSFDFRYASLRFNSFNGETKIFERSTIDNREFYYVVKVANNDGGTLSDERLYLLRVYNCEAHFSTAQNIYLSSYIDSVPTKPLLSVSGSSHHKFTSDAHGFCSGIRPLVLPAVSDSVRTNPSADNTYDFTQFLNGAIEGFGTTSDVFANYPMYTETFLESGNHIFHTYNSVESSSGTGDQFNFQWIPLNITTSSFHSDSSSNLFRIYKVDDNIAIELFDTTSNKKITFEQDFFLNQKVPLSYFLMSTIDEYHSGYFPYDDYFDGVGSEDIVLSVGSVTVDSNSAPIKLIEMSSNNKLVDLIDLSVKCNNGNLTSGTVVPIVSTEFDDSFRILLSSSNEYRFSTKTNSYATFYRYKQPYLQTKKTPIVTEWGLLTFYYPLSNYENISINNLSTSSTDASGLFVLDSLFTDNTQTYIPFYSGIARPTTNTTYWAQFQCCEFKISNSLYCYFVPSLPFSYTEDASTTSPVSYTALQNNSYSLYTRLYAPATSSDSVQEYDSNDNPNIQNIFRDFTDYFPANSQTIIYGFDLSSFDLFYLFTLQNRIGVYALSPSLTPSANVYYFAKINISSFGIVFQQNDNIIYQSVAYTPDMNEYQKRGYFSSNCTDLYIYRRHYQEWCPFVGEDSLTPEGAPTDETTQFEKYEYFSNKGLVESFNGQELFISPEEGYTIPQNLTRLTIDRNHSRYSWDSSKSLDSIVDFNMHKTYDVKREVDIPLKTELYAYELGEDEESVLTKEQTVEFYHRFTPARVDLGLDINVDLTPVIDGGNAEEGGITTFGGGGADI